MTMLKGEEPAALDGDWYEQQLGQAERRRRGHFSTPPELVARMLEWVGYRAGADLEHLAVLDPACGVGNFLAGAAKTLLAQGHARQWLASRMLAALQANLWGLEMDPAACALAELRLRALARNLAPGKQPRFHVHQADALALPAAPRFPLVIGNPPYLAARHHDLQRYQHGYLSIGQRDAYLLFIEQASRFVAPDGWLALVLPDPLLARGNAADARRLLLESFTVKRLLHLEGVFRADVGTLVLIARRVAPSPQYAIPWSRLDWRNARQGEAGLAGTLRFEVWRRQPRAELRYLLGPAEAALFERLAREVPSAPLGELVSISRGEELARGAAVSAAAGTTAGGTSLLPVLRGGLDVRPFRCRFADVYLRRDQVLKPLERYQAPKLLVVKSTSLLSAALDERGYVAVQTLYLLHLKTARYTAAQCSLGYLLALLNSRLLRGYLWLHHTAYKLVQPQIEQEALAPIPIPLAAPAQQAELAALADQLRQHYQEQDEQASKFPQGGTAASACENEAAWIQLGQTIANLSTRLDADIAALCGLTAAEQTLLERLPAPR
jgi:SAM-dependent methyltransferase